MKVTRKVAGAVAATALSLGALSGAASAEDKLNYSWTVAGESDYIFRGISYNAEDPHVYSYLEFTYNLFYLGLYTTNMDYGGSLGPWEQDVYFGIRPTTGPISWDIAAWWYIYGNPTEPGLGVTPGTTDVWDSDYVEFRIGATYSPITNLTLGATVWLTPDQDYGATENVSYEGTIAYTLPQMHIFTPTLSALIGHSDSGTNNFYPTGYWLGEDSYTYWNAGVKLAVDKFWMDLRYWDTDIDGSAVDDWADSRFLFSAGVTLP